MKIGIAGPIATEYVAQHMGTDISGVPRGFSGAPILGTLITTLIDMGHEVSAYTLDRALDPAHEPLLVRGNGGFRIYYCAYRPRSFAPNGRLPGRMLDFFQIERRALQRAIETDAPEVVHAHWTYEYALAAIATGIPHVITCHDSPVQVLRYMPNLYRLGRYFMARKVFHRAQAVSAVSSYLEKQVSKYTRVPITVVPNPLPATLATHTDRCATKNLRAGEPRIAMILNGWGRRKNPQAALKAFYLLRQKIPQATLHLYGYDYGDGEHADIWAKKHGLRVNVTFHGSLSHKQLLSEIQQMDLLLHPAREETMGMAMVEAMVLGVPVIGGNQSGAVPWVLDYGNAGILTDVRSPAAMCQSMLDLFAKPERYQQLTVAGRSRALAEFSPTSVAERYLNLYQQAQEVQARKCGTT